MSLDIGEKLRAKTGHGSGDMLPLHYVSLVYMPEHRDETRPMDEAVDELRTVLGADELKGDPAFGGFFRYLKSMYPTREGNRDSRSTEQGLAPNIDWPLADDYVGPQVDIFGIQMNAIDFADFANYVFTNTGLDGPEDPRQLLLDELRGDREAPIVS